MKLSSPSDVDDTGSSDGSEGDESGGREEEVTPESEARNVTVGGRELTVEEAVEEIGAMVHQPSEFELVSGSQYRKLRHRVEKLEEENAELRDSVRLAFDIMDRAESMSQFALEEGDDPIGGTDS
jgi:hypothetical protein